MKLKEFSSDETRMQKTRYAFQLFHHDHRRLLIFLLLITILFFVCCFIRQHCFVMWRLDYACMCNYFGISNGLFFGICSFQFFFHLILYVYNTEERPLFYIVLGDKIRLQTHNCTYGDFI